MSVNLCPECGFPADAGAAERCPKCDTLLRGVIIRELLEVDIVHQGETWEQAREKLLDALNAAFLHGHKGLKVIHGHGSTSGRSMIAGYACGLMKAKARQYGCKYATDKGNPGASILYFNG